MTDKSTETTRLLRQLADGELASAEQLLPLVYDELHRMAERLMQDQNAAMTLQPTALIHEAYLRLVGSEGEEWECRKHFLRVAARAMRYALIDHVRARGAEKRGGDRRKLTLDVELAAAVADADFLMDLHEALDRLQKMDEQLGQIVELRFFGGLGNAEVARALEVSTRTVERGWRVAQAWLLGAMRGEQT